MSRHRAPTLAAASAALVVMLLLAGCARDLDPAARPTTATTTLPTAAGSPAPPGTPSGTPSGTPGGSPVLGPPIRLDAWLEGFDSPLLFTVDPDGRAYVVEQGGRIHRLADLPEDAGTHVGREMVLDVSEDVRCCGEQGLLGLAFDPRDGRAYIDYTDTLGDSILERVVLGGADGANGVDGVDGADGADGAGGAGGAGAREQLKRVDQPYANHNGGHLAFGPDGHLYWGLGDGGSGGDPQGNGQDIGAELGSLLRIDVSGATGIAVPEGNPHQTYVWAKGLRNPWRFSFDRETDDLYVADVGQGEIEEVNFLPAGSPAGANFGWSIYEGTKRYALTGSVRGEHTPPVAEYTHDDGCSVTGGHVYRGERYPDLQGLYFFGDFCSGKVWALREKADIWRMVEMLDTELSISSFGEDASGELYVVDHGGMIYKLVGTGAPLPDVLRP